VLELSAWPCGSHRGCYLKMSNTSLWQCPLDGGSDGLAKEGWSHLLPPVPCTRSVSSRFPLQGATIAFRRSRQR
jgi:hypothetical protein